MAVFSTTYGNILNSDAMAIVNPVNTVGISGAGLALQFKEKFPEAFREYEERCKSGEFGIGTVFLYRLSFKYNHQFIVFFPTKKDWRYKSRISYIEDGLDALIPELSRNDIRSISIPKLGSGLGGLDWKEVRPLIERRLKSVEYLKVIFYE